MTSLAEALGAQTQEQKQFADNLSSKICRYFEDLNENRLIFVASFCGLLARVIYADGQVKEEEVKSMSALLEELSHIDNDNAYNFSKFAIEEIGDESNLLDNGQYCGALNEILTEEQKRVVLKALCLMAVSDKELVNEEVSELQSIADFFLIKLEELELVLKQVKETMDVT